MKQLDNVVSLDELMQGDATLAPGCTANPRDLLSGADVVYAVNPTNQREILVFGRVRLQQIAESDFPAGVRILRVNVGNELEHLQCLLNLVQQSKGACDFSAADLMPDDVAKAAVLAA